jgi:thiamine-monophosphate kinase
MSLEDKIIKKLNSSFLKPNKNLVGIGDDCAYLGVEDLLISTDTFIENTHFDLKKSSPVQVAKKFFNANYSDLQSSGGRPLYCFLNISFANTKSAFIHHFLKELTSLLKKYKIILMGGDTTKSITDISLTMTLIGKPFNKRIFLRTNAKEEELICTFSNIGFSKLGYDILYKSKKIKDLKLKKQSIEQFLSPKIYSYAAFLAKLKISSCMDLSDGLIIDLIKYSQMSKKRFHLNNLGNLNPTLYKKLNKQDYYNYVLTSGEEFVPIFTIPSNKLVSAVDYFKKNLKVTIVNIGSVLKGSGVTTDEYNLDKIHSFSHFN